MVLTATSSILTYTGSSASTTIFTYTLPANTLGTQDRLEIEATFMVSGNSTQINSCAIKWGTGSATTTIGNGCGASIFDASPTTIKTMVVNNNSQSVQTFTSENVTMNGSLVPITYWTGGTDTKNTGAVMYVAFEMKLGDTTEVGHLRGLKIVKY